jgi:hypothetical protein
MPYKLSDAIKKDERGVFIDIHVISHSKENQISFSVWEPRLRVKIRSPPQKGKANEEVKGLFKRMLGSCEITSGCLSPKKTVFIGNGSPLEVMEKLGKKLGGKFK